MASRQLKWQRAQVAGGRCRACGESAVPGVQLCAEHRRSVAARNLARYWEKRGGEGARQRDRRCRLCGAAGHDRRTCGVA